MSGAGGGNHHGNHHGGHGGGHHGGPGESLTVDLRGLTDFATELTTQLGGMAQPLGQLAALVERELRLGAFGEAVDLGDRHHGAVEELHALVAQARDAIEFAQEVTGMVHTSYKNYDERSAGALGAVTGAVDALAGGLLSIVTTGPDHAR